MDQYTPLISILVFGFGLAFIFGYFAYRLKISPIVGYLFAGIVIGPFTPGYVADSHLSSELAEIGVILLMFGIGLHFSLSHLKSIKHIVIPGACIQMLIVALLGTQLGRIQEFSLSSSILFGISISVASTVVLIRTLEELKLLHHASGRLAVGWLIIEDIAMIFILVLLPPMAMMMGESPAKAHVAPQWAWYYENPLLIFIWTLLKITAFITGMILFGRKMIPRLLHIISLHGSNELFRLAVLSIALAVAFIAAKLFNVSFALGAFFAGMMLSESTLSHRAAEEILPLRDAFSVLFFVSVGMLLHPSILIHEPIHIMITTAFILFGKSFIAFIIVIMFRYSWNMALLIGLSLGQIGEFSFILSSLACQLHLLSAHARDIIVAGAFLSMIANPILFRSLLKLCPKCFEVRRKKIIH